MLDNKNQLRRVAPLGEEPAKPTENRKPEKEASARKALEAAFEAIRK